MENKHSVLGPNYNPTDAVVIQLGAEISGRQGNRNLLALSKVKLTLKTIDDIRKAIDMLDSSDARLSENENSLYDWQYAILHKMSIYFEVAWYDLDFFEEKNEAFLSPEHNRMFAHFNLIPEDFTVRHYKLV